MTNVRLMQSIHTIELSDTDSEKGSKAKSADGMDIDVAHHVNEQGHDRVAKAEHHDDDDDDEVQILEWIEGTDVKPIIKLELHAD